MRTKRSRWFWVDRGRCPGCSRNEPIGEHDSRQSAVRSRRLDVSLKATAAVTGRYRAFGFPARARAQRTSRDEHMTKAGTVLRWEMILLVVCTLMVGPAFSASQSAAATLPKLFTTFTEHGSRTINHFAVRPTASITDSADGGELKFHWTSWTATHATGYGRAYPDHGSWAF